MCFQLVLQGRAKAFSQKTSGEGPWAGGLHAVSEDVSKISPLVYDPCFKID